MRHCLIGKESAGLFEDADGFLRFSGAGIGAAELQQGQAVFRIGLELCPVPQAKVFQADFAQGRQLILEAFFRNRRCRSLAVASRSLASWLVCKFPKRL